MKIKSKQRLRIHRFFSDLHVTISCTYGDLGNLDSKTSGAVGEALKCILDDRFPYKGVRANYNGIDIEVDLLD